MFISVFESIPEALFDAAIIDGASAWKIYTHVYYPEATAPLATLSTVPKFLLLSVVITTCG